MAPEAQASLARYPPSSGGGSAQKEAAASRALAGG